MEGAAARRSRHGAAGPLLDPGLTRGDPPFDDAHLGKPDVVLVALCGDARLAKLRVDEELPMAVLADKDGNVLGSVKNNHGRLSVFEVEELVRSVLDERESMAEKLLRDARRRAEIGDVDAALELYGVVAESRCLCPRQAKAAQKALRKLERK